MPMSEKQIQSFKEANKRFNIWVGAVRSGKTYSSILKLIDLIKNGPKGDIMIIGVNRESIQRNIRGQLYNFLGFPPPSSKTNETKLYDRRVYFVGAHDEGSVRRIQGSTLATAYIDECTCIPEPFFKMLETRLSIKGAQLLATCNPEGLNHWLKKNYLDRKEELDLASWHFTLDDNPSLDETYKKEIKKTLTGAFYRRFILGEWALASGLIYDSFDELNVYENNNSNPNYYIMGIDYGTSNATAAVMLAVTPHQWPQIRVEKEYYYDSIKTGRQKTDDELAHDIKDFIGYRNLRAIYVDPAAASFKLELRRMNLPVLDAKNDIIPGIRVTNKFIANKNIVFHKSCINLIDCIQTYVWDQKASDRGEDKPLKVRDHIMDSLRYACYSGFPSGEFNNPDENLTIEQIRKQVYGESENLLGFGSSGGYY